MSVRSSEVLPRARSDDEVGIALGPVTVAWADPTLPLSARLPKQPVAPEPWPSRGRNWMLQRRMA